MTLLTLHPTYCKHEGFGTLMGHYAAMYSLHKDTGIIPCIVNIDFKQKNTISAMDFFNKFDEPIIYPHQAFGEMNNIFQIISEADAKSISWEIRDLRNLSYDQIVSSLIYNVKNNIVSQWTLNSSLYYNHIKDILEKLFIFQDNLIDRAKRLLPLTDKELVGICVRNEYKKLRSPHVKLSMDFYEKTMQKFDTKSTKYLIFSDDIDECKNSFKHLELTYDIEYTDPMPSAIGICTMSFCNHNICANSSFSYWASMLNKNSNKRILCSTKFIDERMDPILANKLNYKWYPSEWEAVDIV